MKKPMEILLFEEAWAAISLIAAGEVSPFIESLDFNSLQEKQRIGRVCLAIEKVIDKMNVLNRHLYTYYFKEVFFLYLLFKSTNRLNCPHEMEKLKQAIELKMKYDCLLMIKIELEVKLQVSRFFFRNNLDQPTVVEQMNINLLGGTLATPGQLANSLLIKGVSSEEIISIIALKLNERIGLFKDKSSVKQFARWVLNPDMDGPKMQLDCMTNEFKCVIEHYKFFNKDLCAAVVGRYGIFISNKGNPISASNFRSTSYKNLNTRYAIANIFGVFM